MNRARTTASLHQLQHSNDVGLTMGGETALMLLLGSHDAVIRLNNSRRPPSSLMRNERHTAAAAGHSRALPPASGRYRPANNCLPARPPARGCRAGRGRTQMPGSQHLSPAATLCSIDRDYAAETAGHCIAGPAFQYRPASSTNASPAHR